MEAGSIEATIMPVPWNIRMRQMGFNELAFAGNYLNELLTGFAASIDKLANNPEQVKRVLRGFLRSMKVFRSDKKAAVEFIARRFRLDAPVAEESYRIVLQSLSEDGMLSQSVLHEFFESVKKEPGVKKQIGVNDLVDFRLLREVSKEIEGKS